MEWISRREYLAIHAWLRYKYGGANRCENNKCDKKSNHFEWALKSGCSYVRNRDSFIMLCKACHCRYDKFDITKLHSFRDGNCFERINKAKEKKVLQISDSGLLVKEWSSISDAAKNTGVSITAISNNLTNRSKSAGGFIWING